MSSHTSHATELAAVQTAASRAHVKLALVGPMVGGNAGRVTTQGERLAKLFEETGYSVISVSKSPNRYYRLLDIIWTLIYRNREIDFHILQVFGGPSFVVEDAASLISRIFGHKIIMIMRGGEMPVFWARYPRWCQRVLDRADTIITPSKFLQRLMTQHGYASTVIPNIIELDAYRFRHRERVQPRFLWMRAFHPQIYNPAMAIRVFVKIKRLYPEATLVMGGQHDNAEEDVKQLAAKLNVASSVRFAGFLTMEGKQRESADADVFLNTNNIDNMPVSVVEAFAHGLPVVATNVGGIPDLITHEETGLLVPANDDDAMVTAIVRLLDDPALAGRLSANGRAYAESCTWDSVLPKFQKIMSQLNYREMPKEVV